MEKVHFIDSKALYENVKKTFLIHKSLIETLLPEADVQHVGGTAITNSITKGDLDIQVRVGFELFPKAVQELSTLYELNQGSTRTEVFRAFKDDSTTPPLGVQLTVIDSKFDFFWKLRDVLLINHKYRKEYDNLKRKYEGKDMEDYRKMKNKFFEKLMETPEYKQLANS